MDNIQKHPKVRNCALISNFLHYFGPNICAGNSAFCGSSTVQFTRLMDSEAFFSGNCFPSKAYSDFFRIMWSFERFCWVLWLFAIFFLLYFFKPFQKLSQFNKFYVGNQNDLLNSWGCGFTMETCFLIHLRWFCMI